MRACALACVCARTCVCVCVCVAKNGAEQRDGSTQTSASFLRILNSSRTAGLNWRDIWKEKFFSNFLSF